MNSFPTFDFDRFPKDDNYQRFHSTAQDFLKCGKIIDELEVANEKQQEEAIQILKARTSAIIPFEEIDKVIGLTQQIKTIKWRSSKSKSFQEDTFWQTICSKAQEKFQQSEYEKFAEWQRRREKWKQHAIFAHYSSFELDVVYTTVKIIHKLYKNALQDLVTHTLSQDFVREYQKYLEQVKIWKNNTKQALVYSMLARIEHAAKEEDVTNDDLLFPLYNQVNQLLEIHDQKGFTPDKPLCTMTPELFQKFHLAIIKYQRKAERTEIAKRVNTLPWFHEKSVLFGIKAVIHSKQLFVLPKEKQVRTFSIAYSGPSICNLALCTIYWGKLRKLIQIGAFNDQQQIQDIHKSIDQIVDFYIKQFNAVQILNDAKELQGVWKDTLQGESDKLFTVLTIFTDYFFKMVETNSKDIIAICPIFYRLNELADNMLSIGTAADKYKNRRASAQSILGAQFGRAVLKQKMEPSAFFELFSVLTPPQLKAPIDILRKIIRDDQPGIQESILLTLEQVKSALKAIWPQNVNSILKSLIEFLVQKITDPRSPLLSIIKQYDASIQSPNRNEPTYIEQWLSAQNERMKEAQETILKNFPLMEESYYFYGEDDIQSAIEQLKAYSEFEENLLNHLKSHLREYIQKKAGSNYSNVLFGALTVLQDQTLLYEFGKKHFEYCKQSSKSLLRDRFFFELLLLCPQLLQELRNDIFDYLNFQNIEDVIQNIANFADFSFLSNKQKEKILLAIDKYWFSQLQEYRTIDEDILAEKLYKAESFSSDLKFPEFPLTEQYKKEIFDWLNDKLSQHADSALEKVLVRFGTVEQKQTFYTQCFEHVFGEAKSDEIAAQILLKSQLLGYRDFLEKYGDENLPKIFQFVKNFFKNPVFNPLLYTILENNFIIADEDQEQESILDDQNYSMYSYLCQQVEKVFNEQYSVIVNTIDCLEKGSYKKAHDLAEKLEKQVPASGRRIFTETDHHAKEVMKLLFKRIEGWLLEQITDTKKYSIDSIKSFVNLFKKEFLTLFIDKQKPELNELLKPLFTLCEKTSDIFNFCSDIYNLVHSALYTSWLVPFRRKDLSKMFDLLPISAKKFLLNQLIKISLIGQSKEAREAGVLLIAVIKEQSTDRERDLNRIQELAASEECIIQGNGNDGEKDHALLSERNWDRQLKTLFLPCQGDEEHIIQLLRMNSCKIPKEIWDQLFDATGTPLFGKESNRHTVIPVISANKEVFYYKFFPHAPGIQWMRCALRELLWGEKQQKTFKIELAKFPANTGDTNIAYPVLISQEVPGKTLSKLWQENSNIRLNAHSFSREFLRVLIDLEQDGKPENYIAVAMDDGTYQLVNVDGEKAFAFSAVLRNVSATGTITMQLLTKSILFCCPNMKEKIPNEIIDEFLKISPIEFLQTFMREIYRYNTLLLQMFSHKECMQWGNPKEQRFLIAPLREDLIQSIYTTICRIQEAFQQEKGESGITHIELLRRVHPMLASYYEPVLEESIHPSTRFLKVVANEYRGIHSTEKDQEQTLTGQSGKQVEKSLFGFISNSQVEFNSYVIDANKAIEYLESIASQRDMIQKARQELVNGTDVTWKKITVPLYKEQLVNGIPGILPGIKWQNFSEDRQRFILQSIISEMQEKRFSLQALNLSYCSVLSNDMLQKLIKMSPELEFLDISYCTQIDEKIFQDLSLLCPMMRELKINDLLITTICNKELLDSSLEFPQLQHLSCTNCQQLIHVGLRAPKLQNINLADCKKITNQELLDLIWKCPNLEELDLSYTEVSCEDFEKLSHQLSSLKKINLTACVKVTDRTLIAFLQKCPNLEELNFSGTEVSCEDFEKLSHQLSLLKESFLRCSEKVTDRGLIALLQKCPNLEALDLSYTKVSCEDFEKLSHQLSSLKKINLTACVKVTDRGLVALLQKCPNLEELYLSQAEVNCEDFEKFSHQLRSLKKVALPWCREVTDRGLVALLQKCPNLEELDLDYIEVSCKGFEKLSHQLSSLKAVSLSIRNNLTDRGLVALLQKCPNLEELDLSYTEVSCEDFEKLSHQLSSLKRINLRESRNLTEQGLIALLEKCPNLEELYLSKAEVNCEGFGNIDLELKSLKSVQLNNCKKIIDQGLVAFLQKCPNLEELNLIHTEVSCEDFEKLPHQLSLLEEIYLSSCTRLTDRGLIALLQKCPNLKNLELRDVEVSCEGFEKLSHQLSSLKAVSLSSGNNLTDRGLVALLQKCPNLEELDLTGALIADDIIIALRSKGLIVHAYERIDFL